MKIKQAIAATGLTDRAIRLYIANDLIHPQDEKSYTGRSSLSFSEEDIALLNKIAILRKAGFSIAQIKAIETDSEQAQTAVAELLETKQQEQELNGKVIAALTPLKESGSADMDEICGRLWEQMQCREVPKEDMKKSFKEALRDKSYVYFAAYFFFRMIVIVVFAFLGRYTKLTRDFAVPKFDIPFSTFELIIQVSCVIISAAFLAAVFLMFRRTEFNRKKLIIKSVAASAMIAFIVGTSIFIAISWMNIYSSHSESDKVTDYLRIDDRVFSYSSDINTLFPTVAPGYIVYASDERRRIPTDGYHYEYYGANELNDYTYTFEIYASWDLLDDEYEAEKARVLTLPNIKSVTHTTDGWNVFSVESEYNNSEKDIWHYNPIVIYFAYNDTESRVCYDIHTERMHSEDNGFVFDELIMQ